MFHVRARGIHGLFLLCQMGMVSALFWLWLALTQLPFFLEALPLESYVLYNATLLLGVAIGHVTERDKHYFSHPNFRSATHNATWQFVFAIGCVFMYLVGTQDKTISRLFLFSFIPVLYGTLVLCQRYLPPLLVHAIFRGAYEQRVALLGPTCKALSLRSWLQDKSAVGYRTVGVVCDDSEATPVPGLKVLGGINDLEEAIREWTITQVILMGFPQSDETLQYCTEVCERLGVRLLVVCNFEEKFRHSVTLFEDGGLRFVGLRQEPLENPMNRLLKRTMDVVVSLSVVLGVLPVASAIVWALQRWQSPGPVFYCQRRTGLQNRPFVMFKFRTMHVENDDETRQVRKDDPRVFPAGYWLRRFSLDELPQFYNVLRGEMSVVGPRPHLPKHDELFAKAMKNYNVRGVVKPGITGLAQVRGFRGGTETNADVSNRVNSDIQYLETWTLELDCWIVLRTVVQMVRPPRTAY